MYLKYYNKIHDIEKISHKKGEKVVIGSNHERLTVLDIIIFNKVKNNKIVICQCECGNIIKISYSNFKSHNWRNCGCLPRHTTHNSSRTKIYKVWKNINSRCHKENDANYNKYGAKGIDICEEWSDQNKNGFINFKEWALSNGYEDGLTIDRLDETKNYSPSNCRIATYLEQNTHLSMLHTNKTGYKGVWFNHKSNKYRVTISVNNISHNLGEYSTKEQAVSVRNNYIDNNNLLHKKQKYIGEEGYVYGKSY